MSQHEHKLPDDIDALYAMTKDGEIMLSQVSMALDAALKDGLRRGWLRSDGIRVGATRPPEPRPSKVRSEIERIRAYAEEPLPPIGGRDPEARRMALDDRLARVSAWLRNLRDDLDEERCS